VDDTMLGRGLVCRPDLARQIAAARQGHMIEPMTWAELLPLIDDFWTRVRNKLPARFAPGRIKQWLKLLTRTYAEARPLFDELRQQDHSDGVTAVLGRHCRHRISSPTFRTREMLDDPEMTCVSA
jgi:tRNA-dihydrouridine synthase C